jgi:hypothetical protein
MGVSLAAIALVGLLGQIDFATNALRHHPERVRCSHPVAKRKGRSLRMADFVDPCRISKMRHGTLAGNCSGSQAITAFWGDGIACRGLL